MSYTRADDFFYFQGIERRAAAVVWRRYQINKYELNLLAGISAFLTLHGRKIVSRDLFIDWLGGNYRFEKKCQMYIKYLVEKGAVHRLAYRRPDGNCLALSPYGIKILEAFSNEIQAIEMRDKRGKSAVSYKDLGVNLEALPHGYTLMQAGRS